MTRSRLPLRPLALLALGATFATLSACSSTPAAPQITPVNATIKLGRVTEKAFLSRVDVASPGAGYGATGVGVGGFAGGGGGGGGVGLSVDLTRLFSRPAPPQQVDLYRYKVRASDGTVAQIDAPAAQGLEPGTCVRLIYPDGQAQPQMAPSNEC
ncbi:hypothetical protein [Cupriavidus agavae]|uniref:Lipoprotein n=1 Tax=Cupriavidus agavae TaxID=1001822 RepID=A0A4Q7S5P9_9BURK|nr:hypothetical protein [Cupriavidus agavae]RZT41028.1 hypothetical protein EV147_0013 [Cupriavidus agavae]